MDNHTHRKKKGRDKKPLYILLSFILVFALFIFLITRPSEQSKALDELKVSYNKKDVEMVWYKYKLQLFTDEEFLFAVRKKLVSFELSDLETQDCIGWLPPAPISINLIVVPDLSRRINDHKNNPNQIANDKIVFDAIWSSFVEYSKLKKNSEDRLIVQVTDKDQAKGQFDQIANELQFDLSEHDNKINKLYFTEAKTKQFAKNIGKMYDSARQKPLGADYVLYFKRYLSKSIKKNTLFNSYKNKVIIITDGYLEPENKPAYTKIYPQLYKSANISQFLSNRGLNIPKVDVDLSGTEILICEVNERLGAGQGNDFEVLKAYWENWLHSMNAKPILFEARNQASNVSAKTVKDFILK